MQKLLHAEKEKKTTDYRWKPRDIVRTEEPWK
jgi:hypothetical protein